ncbi:MAG TPA: hypothetical protein VHO06_04995 [Polyangia bacterium]|nr:hypothetical protein [Polyangia bacterium]
MTRRPPTRRSQYGSQHTAEVKSLARVQAAIVFAKLLAARAGDALLIGHAEFLGLQIEEAEAQLYALPDAAPGIAIAAAATEEPSPKGRNVMYSSDDFTAVLIGLGRYRKSYRYPKAVPGLGPDWIVDAAAFVKRLASAVPDVELVGQAEMIVIDDERSRREEQLEAERAEEEEQREYEEREAAKWDTYEHVTENQIGLRLSPQADRGDVKDLLEMAGLLVKDGRRLVLTEAGMVHANPRTAKLGDTPKFPGWSKSVLPILQATLEKSLAEQHQRPLGAR